MPHPRGAAGWSGRDATPNDPTTVGAIIRRSLRGLTEGIRDEAYGTARGLRRELEQAAQAKLRYPHGGREHRDVRATPTPQDVRYGHPTLYVNHVDPMSAFYELLGFDQVFRFPEQGAPVFATMQKGTYYIALATYDAIRQATGLPRIRRAANHQLDIAVIVEDVDATVSRLRASGVPVLMVPKDQPWGERQAYVEDPEGNYVLITTHSI